MGKEARSGKINGSERGLVPGGHSGEGWVGDSRAEGEVEVGDGWVTFENGSDVIGTEWFECFPVTRFGCVERFGDEGECFFVEWVRVEVVEDYENEFFGEEIKGSELFLLLHRLENEKKSCGIVLRSSGGGDFCIQWEWI